MADLPTLPRHLEGAVLDALGHARVVLVNGPRQAGKTTLGLILYRGQTVVPFGPRVHAAPIDALWRWGAS